MKGEKSKFKKDFNPEDSLNDFIFHKHYNKNLSKKKFKNSLSPEEIERFDKIYSQTFPPEVQEAQMLFSKNSNQFNDFINFNNGIYHPAIGVKYGLSEKKYYDMKNNLDKSYDTLKEETILYKGLPVSAKDANLDILRNEKGYVSTSFDRAIAEEYAREEGALLIMIAPPDTGGYYLRHYSKHPSHMEWTLSEDTCRTDFLKDVKNNVIYADIKKIKK